MGTLQRMTEAGWRDMLTVEGFFRWYDLWIGAYWDRKEKTLYVCPVPMLGIKVVLHWLRTPQATTGDRK